jgi:hypothetical protein
MIFFTNASCLVKNFSDNVQEYEGTAAVNKPIADAIVNR